MIRIVIVSTVIVLCGFVLLPLVIRFGKRLSQEADGMWKEGGKEREPEQDETDSQ